MKAPAVLAVPQRVDAPSWRSSLAPLCFGLLLLGVVFQGEIGAAVATWSASTAYNHCFLIIPITLYLLWDRRNDLADLFPAPCLPAAALALPVALAWLVAERLGIMEGRQIAAIGFADVLFLAVLGPRFCRAIAGPLLYLYFLVPFGEFLTPGLQDVTTCFIRHGLDILGVPAFVDGHTIEIPQGIFFVAEACAGLRFLIASVAFGCLYAMLIYRSASRRAVFIALSVLVPIGGNGLRGLGIVYLGYRLNSAEAAAADHIVYGWVFFSCVLLALTGLGLPFRQDHLRNASWSCGRVRQDRPVSMRAMSLAAVAVAVLAAAGPAMLRALPQPAAPTHSQPIAVGADCTVQPAAALAAGGQGRDVQDERLNCGGMQVDLAWEALSPRATAALVMAARYRLTQRAATESLAETWLPTADGPSSWRILTSNDPVYVTAVSVWVDGRPVRPGLRLRAAMAWSSLFGTSHAPIVASVTEIADWDTVRFSDRDRLQAQLETFLLTHPDLEASIEATSRLW